MRTLEEIRERCEIDGTHWIWQGALLRDGRPNIHAPDYTNGGVIRKQNGMRAVWHCAHKQPIPPGWRAYGTCEEKACCNPAHIVCTNSEQFGLWIKKTAAFKGNTKRILANRAIGRKMSKLSPELIAEIQLSEESTGALADRLRLSRATIGRARRGQTPAFRGIGSMFSALISPEPTVARI